MDKISQLPDELLLKVLLFLPTKVAARTSILSKRWEFLWMWLPKLEYNNSNYSKYDRQSLCDFINFNLPLHRAPVLETLRLNFRVGSPKPEDMKLWLVFAVSRCIRELSLNLASSISRRARLPSSLYTCKSLVILELKDMNVVDIPRMACLPSLKILLLQDVAFADDKSFHQFLSSCPIIEDLVLERFLIDHFETPSVTVPSLQRLTLEIFRGYLFNGIVINTPSLKCFRATDYIYEYNEYDLDSDSYSFYSEDMIKLEEVEVDSTYPNIDNCVSSITYIKRLSLCLRVEVEKALYREGIVFNQLQHLKLCSCTPSWSKLLVRLLKDSPNLRELEVYQKDDHTHCTADPRVCWQSQLDCVPTCLLSSLETFKWTGIYRSQKEIDLMKYILRNARCLKAATFLFSPSYTPEEKDKHEMVKQDLSLSFRDCEDMDKISQLPDELLLKVLLSLPTKAAASTSILSKRWEFLWLWLPKLEYEQRKDGRQSIRDFLNFNMPLHKAPVIESLRFSFGSVSIEPEDIRQWVLFAVCRCIRELSINFQCSDLRPAMLPSSLYTCETLVILELKEVNIVDVPRMACLPSLKTLLLQDVAYADAKTFHHLLSSCPILEDLSLERHAAEHDFLETLSFNVPSLQRLTLKICRGYIFRRFEINTPSLKYFKATDYTHEDNPNRNSDWDNDSDSDCYYFQSEDMPRLEEVEVDSTYPDIDNIVSSGTYIKRLSLCLSVQAEKALYREGIVFDQLQHLKICSCVPNWSKLLVRLVKDSPVLRELEVYHNYEHGHYSVDPQVCWLSQLDCVPTCLLSSLETFKWTGRYRSQNEIDLMKYILRNARCLKAATFLFSPSYTPEQKDKNEMVKQDLSLSFRGSKACHLVFY